MYPEYIEINKKEYKIDTDFKVALNCFEILDKDISDYEKALAICYLLFDIVPSDEELPLFMNKAKIYLQCGKSDEEQKKNKRDMDLMQDRRRIYISFLSDYRIDLNKEKMHFWQFIDGIEGLTDSSILNRVRDIRNYDLSKEKDSKRRNEIIEAKKQVALKDANERSASQQIKNEAVKIYEKLGLRKE